MSTLLVDLHLSKVVVQVKLSDCWCIDGKPVRWSAEALNNPAHPEWTGFRLVCLWLAVWIVWPRFCGGGVTLEENKIPYPFDSITPPTPKPLTEDQIKTIVTSEMALLDDGSPIMTQPLWLAMRMAYDSCKTDPTINAWDTDRFGYAAELRAVADAIKANYDKSMGVIRAGAIDAAMFLEREADRAGAEE